MITVKAKVTVAAMAGAMMIRSTDDHRGGRPNPLIGA